MDKDLIDLCQKYGLDWNTAAYLAESIIVNIKPVWQREVMAIVFDKLRREVLKEIEDAK